MPSGKLAVALDPSNQPSNKNLAAELKKFQILLQRIEVFRSLLSGKKIACSGPVFDDGEQIESYYQVSIKSSPPEEIAVFPQEEQIKATTQALEDGEEIQVTLKGGVIQDTQSFAEIHVTVNNKELATKIGEFDLTIEREGSPELDLLTQKTGAAAQ